MRSLRPAFSPAQPTRGHLHEALPGREQDSGAPATRQAAGRALPEWPPRYDRGMDLSARPDRGEYADFYAGYVDAVPDGDIRETLAAASREMEAFYAAIP